MSEVKRRGRPKKVKVEETVDKSAVESVINVVAKEKNETDAQKAKRQRSEDDALKKQNQVAEKWHELRGEKLILCVRKSLGSVYRTYLGKIKTPRVKEFARKLEKEGKLRQVKGL